MTTTGDRVRTAALAVSTAAVIGVPTLGPRIPGAGRPSDGSETPITPPGYAFAVWGPVFAALGVDAARALLPGHAARPDQRAAGWPLVAAESMSTLWAVGALTRRPIPGVLPAGVAAAALAHLRLQSDGERGESTTTVATGLLLGWTALAAAVDTVSKAVAAGADPRSPRTVGWSTAGLAATAAGAAAAITASRRGAVPFALTAVWGLATTALVAERPAPVRLVAGAGAVAAAAAAVVSTLRHRRR